LSNLDDVSLFEGLAASFFVMATGNAA